DARIRQYRHHRPAADRNYMMSTSRGVWRRSPSARFARGGGNEDLPLFRGVRARRWKGRPPAVSRGSRAAVERKTSRCFARFARGGGEARRSFAPTRGGGKASP